MDWINITNEDQIEVLNERSCGPESPAVIVFKHSPRCSISIMAKDRLERKWSLDKEKFPAYYIDVLTSRPASNHMAEKYNVTHESPQVFVIKQGKCVYTASHSEISYDDLVTAINN